MLMSLCAGCLINQDNCCRLTGHSDPGAPGAGVSCHNYPPISASLSRFSLQYWVADFTLYFLMLERETKMSWNKERRHKMSV